MNHLYVVDDFIVLYGIGERFIKNILFGCRYQLGM